MHRRLLTSLLSVCLLASLLLAAPVSARALTISGTQHQPLSGGGHWTRLGGSISPQVYHAHRLHALSASRQIGITVTLQVNDQSSLDRYLGDLYNPSSPSYRHFVTAQQFAQRFGPSAETRAETVSWLKSQGLHVTGTSRNGLQISARASASKMQAAFGTSLFTFQQGSRTFVANTQALRIPATLAPHVVAVSGLSTAGQQQLPSGTRFQPHAVPQGRSPSEMNHAYGLDSLSSQGINGSGQSIAVLSFADYDTSDIATFDQQYGLSSSVSRIAVSDGRTSGGRLGSRYGQDEAEADIEMVQATVPSASVLLYEAPNTENGAVNLYNRIVSDNRASVITTSWGSDEGSYTSGTMDAIHQAILEASAQGQAFFAASGDAGAYDAAGSGPGTDTQLAVDYPASDPYVTGVGGTSLQLNGSSYAGETVWSDPSQSAGSGGGLSHVFSQPSWQQGPGVSNQYSNGMRQVPDVAADADPSTAESIYTVDSHDVPNWSTFGGTSGAAPLWAGFAVRIVQGLGKRVGTLNPSLYLLGQKASSFSQSPYHDVTQGDNLYYPATSGWDFATGWGSFNAPAFLSDLKSLGGAVTVPIVTPSPAPSPTVTVPPSISIKQVVLLHTVKGKLQTTSSLKVGETGRLVILYSTKHAGSLHPSGKIVVSKNGQSVQSLTLKVTTYGGKPALVATVHFTSTKRVGTLSARVTVKLGSVSAARNYALKLVR